MMQKKFIKTLELKYGLWNRATSRFGSSSFGSVSKDLSISASQFSKLIYGTATEGMYERTIANINRLILNESLSMELEKAKHRIDEQRNTIADLDKVGMDSRRKRLLGLIFGLAFGILASSVYYNIWSKKSYIGDELLNHPLSEFFDQNFNANFNSPYLDVSEVQEYCPCSAFEGTWSLNKPYKLPLPANRKPGIYYVGKSADVRMKCSRYELLEGKQGRILFGYEYLVNEIWVDTELTPLSPKYFDKKNLSYTAEFEELDFGKNENFRKVATIHSFFIDEFEIHNDSIVRKGEPYGRYASDIDERLANKYKIDVKYVLNNVLSNLTTTSCSSTINAYCDANELVEKESIIAFNCTYTIASENLGMGGGYPYQKGYRLEEQHYGDNLTCTCAD